MQNQLFNCRSSSGFTLLEMLIVITVIGILAAIAVPTWQAFLEVIRLNTAQDQVYSAMREAQNQAKHEKLTWQVSFREANEGVQWAVHPAISALTDANWNNLDSHVRLDPETTVRILAGVRKVQFDYKGNIIFNATQNSELGRVTLSSRNGGTAKRCVIVSTLIGAIRTAKENPRPKQGRYCY